MAPKKDDSNNAIDDKHPVESTARGGDKGSNIDHDVEIVRWRSPDYIQGNRGIWWYIIFIIIVIGLMALAFFVMKSITFTVLLPIMAIALVVYTYHPPVEVDYTLSRKGLYINDRLYGYDTFREFVLQHGDVEYSVVLIPRARFQPGLTAYFPADIGEAVIDALASRLPMREANISTLDRLIRLLKI